LLLEVLEGGQELQEAIARQGGTDQGIGKVRIDYFTGWYCPGEWQESARGASEPARLRRTGQGRLAAVRAVRTSWVSWRLSSTLAGPSRELSRPWQQASTWSITAA